MRVFLAVLLLINVVYFLSVQFGSEGSGAENVRVDPYPKASSLMLLSEYQNKRELPQDGSLQKICFSLGPFSNKTRALVMLDEMKEKGFVVAVREIEQQNMSGYWVYLPPYPDREKALLEAKKLKAKGFDDYFVVTAEEQKHAVSLGLFSVKWRAIRHHKRLLALGYNAQMTVRYKSVRAYWVDYDEFGAQSLDSAAWSGLRGVRRIGRDCRLISIDDS